MLTGISQEFLAERLPPWIRLIPERENTLGGGRKLSHVVHMSGLTQTHLAAEGRVVSNPNILEGKPIFLGTRVPVSTFFEYLADGLSLDYFLESFPTVTREHALAVLRYGQRRIENELAA